jgi:hypothetical protein
VEIFGTLVGFDRLEVAADRPVGIALGLVRARDLAEPSGSVVVPPVRVAAKASRAAADGSVDEQAASMSAPTAKNHHLCVMKHAMGIFVFTSNLHASKSQLCQPFP